LLDTSSDKTPSITLFVAAAFWGLYWLPLREIGAVGLPTAWSVAFFNACPLLVLIPYVIVKRKTYLTDLRAVALVALLTGLGLSFYATGLVVSTVIRATLLFYLTPIWSTIIGMIWLKEKLSTGRVFAIVIGLGGLWLLLSGDDGTSVPLNIGDLFALLSGVFWGFGAAAMKKWPGAPTLTTSMGQFAVTLVVSSFLALVVFETQIPPVSAFVAAFPIAFFASTFVLLPSLLAIFWASKRLFPGRVGILMMSEALVAILTASWLLPEETMSFWQWVGGIIIITACFVEVLTKDEKTA